MTGATTMERSSGANGPRGVRRRLRRSADVRAVLQRGKAFHSRILSVHCMPSDDGSTRTAFVAGRKVGGAVQRNLAKRRLRAAVQETSLPEGIDVVIVARPQVLSIPFSDLQATLAEQVRRCARTCRS